jgi:hypothetical protein
MDQVHSKASDSAPSVPLGERVPTDVPPPSMNDLEALDIVKVSAAFPLRLLLFIFIFTIRF